MKCLRGWPKGHYESISLMVFLCILLVVTIVNIMDFVHYFSMGSPIIGQGVAQATNLQLLSSHTKEHLVSLCL